jgi:arylformamidase
MRTYDISVVISPDMPTWPGHPEVVLERFKKLEEGGSSNVSILTMSVHAGTHVDAPFHFLQDGKSVERLSLKTLTGRAYVLHLSGVKSIDAEVLDSADIPPRTRRLLLRTENSQLWAKKEKEFNPGFVGLTADGAEYLVRRGIKLLGVDYLSVAPYKETRPTHEVLLKAGVVIVEGLDLSEVSQGRYTLYCLPLKLEGCDGAPARAILVGV